MRKLDRGFIEWKAEVKKQMVLQGRTMRDLAKETHYNREYVYAIFQGARVSQPVVDSVSEALGITPYEYPEGAGRLTW